MELTDPGFDHTVLSEFRSRRVQGQAEQKLLDTLLDRSTEQNGGEYWWASHEWHPGVE